MNLQNFFEAEANVIKSAPKIYHALLDLYNLNPINSLFVDDKEANVQAGQVLDIDGIVFCDYQSFYRERLWHGLL